MHGDTGEYSHRIEIATLMKEHVSKQTFSACMFCFLIAGHVMVLQNILSFICRPMRVDVRAYVCIISEKTKGVSE